MNKTCAFSCTSKGVKMGSSPPYVSYMTGSSYTYVSLLVGNVKFIQYMVCYGKAVAIWFS